MGFSTMWYCLTEDKRSHQQYTLTLYRSVQNFSKSFERFARYELQFNYFGIFAVRRLNMSNQVLELYHLKINTITTESYLN